MIASVPIAVLAMTLSFPEQTRPDNTWTRTSIPYSTPATTLRLRTAAILDQLAVYAPNEDLIQAVRKQLVQAGYDVDVFSGARVTVELYRQLPSMGYHLIILCVHSTSTRYLGEGRTISGQAVVLLSGDRYDSSMYPFEQVMRHVFAVSIDAGIFFGIGPEFVSSSMKGTFQNTVVVLAGCESLANKDLAKALVARGASHVIGWSDKVGIDHNDKAIISLIGAMYKKRLAVASAVQETMGEIGKDPIYQSILIYYSREG